MQITQKQIVKVLDYLYPESNAQANDVKSTLLSTTRIVDDVLIAMEINNIVVDFAIKNKVQLVVIHHPVFWKKVRHLQKLQEAMADLKKANIGLICYHSTFDFSKEGMNDSFLEVLGAKMIGNFPDIKSPIRKGVFEESLTEQEIVDRIKDMTSVRNILTVDKGQSEKYSKIAVCLGKGFKHFWNDVIDNGNKLREVDCLITCDMDWHDWAACEMYDIKVFNCDHSLENIFVDIMSEKISRWFPSIKITTAHIDIPIKPLWSTKEQEELFGIKK